jgi:hypothetical protein
VLVIDYFSVHNFSRSLSGVMHLLRLFIDVGMLFVRFAFNEQVCIENFAEYPPRINITE